jgi:protein involved in polysaccharide export with SLBB domain
MRWRQVKKLSSIGYKRSECGILNCKYTTKVGYNRNILILSYIIISMLFPGCGNKFFDPSQIGRFRPVPAVNVILDSLGVAEETPMAWEEAEEPHPIDTVVTESDYALMPGDVVRVAIFELLQEGIQFVSDYIVTETGRISIPDVGVIKAAGLTETQLEEEIKRILSPSILKEPSVSVILTGSQQRSFSILGNGVPAPSRYTIPRYNFRLTDALAMAGGPQQFNVSYIYVSRYIGSNENEVGAKNPGYGDLNLGVNRIEPAKSIQQLQSRMLSNRSKTKWPRSNVVVSSSEMITERESALLTGNYGNREDQNRFMKNTDNPQGSLYGFNNVDSINDTASVEEVMGTFDEQYKNSLRVNQQEDIRNRYSSIREPVRSRNISKLEEALRTTVSTSVPNKINNQMGRNKEDHIEWIFQNGKWVPYQVGSAKKIQEKEKEEIEWIFQDGKWIPVQVGTTKAIEPEIQMEPGKILTRKQKETKAIPVPGLEEEGAKTRLIKIPVDKLLAGDPRYNIVIKPGDSIFVPVDIVGEFYIGGNVNRTGTITITGRPLTLKQAIVAAGGLGPLAWPKRCEVVRRIGRKKEEIVMVDLDKIASGEQPDFFIKPNDLINVGTHATSRWRAILRNAFRATYGFGFVYDRNFADRDQYTHRPIPDWF